MIGGGINNLGIGLVLQAVGANTTAASIGTVSTAAQKLAQSFSDINFSAMRYGFDQIARLGIPVYNVLKKGAGVAMEFEKGMAGIQRVVDPESFKKHSDVIRQFAKDMAYKYPGEGGFTSALEAIRELVKTGVSPELENFRKVAESAFAIGRIEGGNMATVMKQLVQFSIATTGTLNKLPEMGNKVARLALDIPGGVKDVLMGVTNMSGISKKLEGGTDEMMAFIGMLNMAGFAGGKAGTVFSRMLQQMATATWKTSDPIRELYARTGQLIEPMDKATGKFRPMTSVIMELGSAIDRLPGDERAGFISRLFGSAGVKAFSSLFELLKTNPSMYTDFLNNIANVSADFATNQASAGGNNVWGAFNRLNMAMQTVSVNMGEVWMKILDVHPGVSSLASSINDVGDAYRRMFHGGEDFNKVQESLGLAAVVADKLQSFTMGLASGLRSLFSSLSWIVSVITTIVPAELLGRILAIGTGVTVLGLGISVMMLGFRAMKGTLMMFLSWTGLAAPKTGQMALGITALTSTLNALNRTLVEVFIAAKLFTEQMAMGATTAGVMGNRVAELNRQAAAGTLFAQPGSGPAGAVIGPWGRYKESMSAAWGRTRGGAALAANPVRYGGATSGLGAVGTTLKGIGIAGAGLVGALWATAAPLAMVGTVGYLLYETFSSLWKTSKEELAQRKLILEQLQKKDQDEIKHAFVSGMLRRAVDPATGGFLGDRPHYSEEWVGRRIQAARQAMGMGATETRGALGTFIPSFVGPAIKMTGLESHLSGGKRTEFLRSSGILQALDNYKASLNLDENVLIANNPNANKQLAAKRARQAEYHSVWRVNPLDTIKTMQALAAGGDLKMAMIIKSLTPNLASFAESVTSRLPITAFEMGGGLDLLRGQMSVTKGQLTEEQRADIAKKILENMSRFPVWAQENKTKEMMELQIILLKRLLQDKEGELRGDVKVEGVTNKKIAMSGKIYKELTASRATREDTAPATFLNNRSTATA